MKVKGSLLVLVCTLVAFAAPSAFGKSSAALLGKRIVLSTIKLEGSNGYEVEVDGFRFGKAKAGAFVKVRSGPLASTYLVETDPGPGIHAAFGELGAIGVGFHRQTRKVLKLGHGCRWITEKGVFRGAFRFTGEQSYVNVEAADPAGERFLLPHGFCGLGSFRPGLPGVGLRRSILVAKGQADHGAVTFEALRFLKSNRSSFDASLKERAGEMKIERSAQVEGGKQSFLDSGASKAVVAPPAPFVGSAELRNSPQVSPSWTGDLSVSFLGAPETLLTGETFAARLCPRQLLFKQCRL